jgi:EAL domain-containing protein (putative c-di-GMP-specific phosphodiesterase class I)/ActR/RegA family two-component response regulator
MTTASPPQHPLPKSALVIDDSSVQRQHAAALCVELGIRQVHEASNGAEALDVLAGLAEAPGVLIVDLEMPGMNGVELIQNLQRREWRIPIIVASSRETALISAVEAMTQALGLEVLAALQKPLNLMQIASALHGRGQPRKATVDETLTSFSVEDLRSAIDDGQLVPYYQPKIDVRTGVIKGVEALARWQRPDHSMVSPDRFIAVAEQSQLIHALTLSIAEQACAQAALWNKRGLRLSMAINLSPVLLESDRYVDDVCRLIERHAIRADQIVWEITESSVVANIGAALGVLARLRLKGFGLSLDDYGTGFSSMQQLARIPFTELKVDRSFVNGASERDHLRVILQSALEMANRLNLVTVAEGVERLEDWQLLQDYGCALGQGYLVARPMPGAELPVWLRTHARHLRSLHSDQRDKNRDTQDSVPSLRH